jgi:glycosyltransferase involved in cell wall biosynthesis
VALGFSLVIFVFVLRLEVIWTGLIVLSILPVMVDGGRMYAARFNDADKSRRTLIDGLASAGCFGVSLVAAYYVNGAAPLITVEILATVAAGLMLARLFLAQRQYRLPDQIIKDDLPSVTLAIPARNETLSLAECLAAATQSDYKKLEIMVLDDCSQDRTSQIIRSFAQEGVQFVQGEQPSSGWLGKNYAMRELARRANGEFIVFMGVDTRLGSDSLSQIISFAIDQQADMVSVLPRQDFSWHASGLLSNLRYFWQLARPIGRWSAPVSSELFAIKNQTLEKLGGFGREKHQIVPENVFARRLGQLHKYRFLLAGHGLKVSSAKKWSSQMETSTRLLYPNLGRRPIFAAVAMAACLLLLSPYVAFAGGLISQTFDLQFYLALAAVILLSLAAVVGSSLIKPSFVVAWLTMPWRLAQEIVLLMISTLAYEFAEVNWKSRNICYPVMQPGAGRRS